MSNITPIAGRQRRRKKTSTDAAASAPKTEGRKKIRSATLDDRRWTPELRKLHLEPTSPGYYDPDEVERVEATPEWQRDVQRAKKGWPVSYDVRDLKARGWSDTMRKQLLGEPDRVIEVTKSRKYYLYRAERVEEVDSQPEFIDRIKAAERRSEAGRAAARRRAEAVREAAEEIAEQLVVQPPSTLEELRRLALRHKSMLDSERGKDGTVYGADDEHVDRWMRNYLRHEGSNYEAMIAHLKWRFKGQPGVREIYEEVVRPRIDELVEDAIGALEETAANAS